jgi:hypothetical protein
MKRAPAVLPPERDRLRRHLPAERSPQDHLARFVGVDGELQQLAQIDLLDPGR